MEFDLFAEKELTDFLTPKEIWSIAEVFEAYYECRRKKRNKPGALSFETDLEANLVELWKELNNGTYKPGISSVFIVDKPVKREIFAAGFRDRVVHHLLIRRINPLFEKEFIYDSYACRTGKGTHFGIHRISTFIRKCSENYTNDCFVLKLDIQGFFMHIDRALLQTMVEGFLLKNYKEADLTEVLVLCKTIITNDPALSCIRRSPPEKWRDVPPDKSLFQTPDGKGLPIGNLSSQVFANFYLNPLDHYIKSILNVRYYGRYVDDLVLVHENRQILINLIPRIRNFLWYELGLVLHPKKIKLQHYTKGVPFLGVIIKPGRNLPGQRTRENFISAIENQNAVVAVCPPNNSEKKKFRAIINSYLGILKQCASWKFRVSSLCFLLSPFWKQRFHLPRSAGKLVYKYR